MNRATLILFLSTNSACLAGCARAGSRDGLITRPSTDAGGAGGAGGTGGSGSMSDGAAPLVMPPQLSVDGSMMDSSTLPMHPAVPPQSTLSAGTVPANPAAIFGAAQADPASPAPVLAYPTPETMFPPNMPDILFQWQASFGNLFRLHFVAG